MAMTARPANAVPWRKKPTKGLVVRLRGGMARLDARRVRLHHFSVDHGGDQPGFWRAVHRGNRRVTATLVTRLFGAVASDWPADRVWAFVAPLLSYYAGSSTWALPGR